MSTHSVFLSGILRFATLVRYLYQLSVQTFDLVAFGCLFSVLQVMFADDIKALYLVEL